MSAAYTLNALARNYNANDKAYAIDCLLRIQKHADKNKPRDHWTVVFRLSIFETARNKK